MSLWKAVAIVIVCVLVASVVASATSHQNAVEARADPAMPQQQRAFLAAVEAGRNSYAAGSNDMAKGAARPMRASAICSALGSSPIDDWTGTVSKLSSNGDGKGVLEIEIGRNVFVKTWNNALSDIVDKTLFEPDSSIYREAVSLTTGQRVRFSGMFLDSSTDCVKEGSLTLDGSLTEPEFIFRFSQVSSYTQKASYAQQPSREICAKFSEGASGMDAALAKSLQAMNMMTCDWANTVSGQLKSSAETAKRTQANLVVALREYKTAIQDFGRQVQLCAR